jgi:hypothetical protein
MALDLMICFFGMMVQLEEKCTCMANHGTGTGTGTGTRTGGSSANPAKILKNKIKIGDDACQLSKRHFGENVRAKPGHFIH